MSDHQSIPAPDAGWPLTRREMLSRSGLGMASLGLGTLLADAGLGAPIQAEAYSNPMQPRAAHFPAKAKHVIHLFMNGGAVTRRHLRSEAAAAEVRWPEATHGEPAYRTQDRRRVRLPVQF